MAQLRGPFSIGWLSVLSSTLLFAGCSGIGDSLKLSTTVLVEQR
jgi:hypothetical protein